MKPTRRWWTLAGLGLLLIAWAVIVESSIVLVGAAAIGGFLLATQLHFVTAVSPTKLDFEQKPARSRVTAGETVPVSLSVAASSTAFSLTVWPQFPASVDAAETRLHLSPDEYQESTTIDLTVPIAGTVTLERPTVLATDRLGLYEQRIHIEANGEIAVDPRELDDLHVGIGGDPIAVAFGEHESGRLGSGLEPAEIRRYVPGEAVRQMDWKATARRGEPHVREFEAETDRVTALILDVRNGMAEGPAGETKLDHLRQVALAFVDRARRRSDPLGCYTVGDGGLTGTFDPSANANLQRTIRHHITTAEPTPTGTETALGAFDPATARQRANRLGNDAFGTALKPFLENPSAYVKRISDRPLFAAVRNITTQQRGSLWTVILTDDSDRTEVREAVRLARSGGGNVLVFLTPTILFEPGGLTDLDAAYEAYAEFETFRRSLAGIERVEAFEVGPGDRLASVLGATTSGGSTRGHS